MGENKSTCNFCDEIEDYYDPDTFVYDYFTKIYKNDDNHFVLPCGESALIIDFCPKCGRKLK